MNWANKYKFHIKRKMASKESDGFIKVKMASIL